MAFDTETGALHFDDGLVVGPSSTWSELEPRLELFSSHGEHRSLHGSASIDGTRFSIVVWFRDEVLERVSLTVDEPEISGTAWNDYDPETVRRFHDAWVTDRVGETTPWNPSSAPCGGIERDYRWGTIGSYLHPQDGAASMTITYGR